MKILKIEISNIIGLQRAEIVCGQPITLAAGCNEAGKSSLIDALCMALNGEPKRVKLKKNLGDLLHNGAKKGSVRLIGAGDEVLGSFTLPAGKHELGETLEKAPGLEFLPLVLDPHAFAQLDDKARRSTLFSLTGSSAKPEYILGELKKAGCNMALAEQIIAIARSGFPAMVDEAKKRASEARGVWQNTTGENWGSDKGDGWELEVPAGKDVTNEDLDQAIAEQTKVQHQIEDGVAYRAKLLAAIEFNAGYASTTAELREKADLLKRATAKREATAADLDKQIDARNKLNAQLGTTPPCACPHCGGAVLVVNGELKDGSTSLSAAERKKAKAELAKVVEAIAMLERTHANDDQAVTAATLAAQQLEAHLAKPPQEIAPDQLEKTDAALLERRQALATATAKREALQERHHLLARAELTNRVAAEKHAEIIAWQAIAEQLAPTGIPSRLLAKALAPINTALETMARMTAWSVPAITDEMALTYGGRDYGLCSESARWRFDVMLALVIAQLSGLKFALIDRLDVLSLKHRPKLAGLVAKLVELGNLDSVVMCGTMKAKPAMPDEFRTQSLWIEKGVVLSEGIE